MLYNSTTSQQPSRFSTVRDAILNFVLVKKGNDGFRTFHGVFLPSILSILGVILYLRLGWIIGEMGFLFTTSIICLATSITLITAFSISASSTNMHIGNGGAYFIISRSFGVAIGSAVGIPLYCAQAIGIAFYIMGFAESIHYLFPFIDINLIEFGTLATLGIISVLSTNLVMRTQFFIFLIVMLSLVSFFLGVEVNTLEPPTLSMTSSLGYWAAFALFFPAVTGLESGVSMSGELKNPQRSLPLGTISAVLMGLMIYLSVAFFLWMRVPRQMLLQDSMIMETIAWSGPLILFGIFGATLSSALGSLLAAPRTLQAIADDGIVPKFIGKKFGKNAEPRIASFVTLLIVSVCLYLGDLNYIAPVLTMFFLISYGMLNLAAGLESLMNNPSWRPTIYIPASLSLLGAALCITTMLLIDASYTLLAGLFVSIIYIFMKRRLTSALDDIRQGVILFFLRKAIYFLAETSFSARSWRPNILAFTHRINPPDSLIDFTSGITGGKGFLTFAYCYQGEQGSLNVDKVKHAIKQTLRDKHVESLVEVVKEQNILNGFKNMIKAYGLSPLRPNTIVMNINENNLSELLLPQIISSTYESHKNLILLIDRDGKTQGVKPYKQIDVWWDDDLRESNDLMILLAHMYSNSGRTKNVPINLNSVVKNEMGRQGRLAHFKTVLDNNRLQIQTNVYVCDKEDQGELVSQFSDQEGMMFIGVRPMQATESFDDYIGYIKQITQNTKKHRLVALFLATEKIELD